MGEEVAAARREGFPWGLRWRGRGGEGDSDDHVSHREPVVTSRAHVWVELT